LNKLTLSASNFGTEMQDGSFLRMNVKMTHKFAWPGLRDPIAKI